MQRLKLWPVQRVMHELQNRPAETVNAKQKQQKHERHVTNTNVGAMHYQLAHVYRNTQRSTKEGCWVYRFKVLARENADIKNLLVPVHWF